LGCFFWISEGTYKIPVKRKEVRTGCPVLSRRLVSIRPDVDVKQQKGDFWIRGVGGTGDEEEVLGYRLLRSGNGNGAWAGRGGFGKGVVPKIKCA
jgi:hypothetical protein